MDRISSEAKLLSSNDIKTMTELFLYVETLKKEIKELEERRDKLYYQNTKIKKEERQENYDELSCIASKIHYLKGEVVKCKEIEERVPKIKQSLKELEEELEKGKERNVYEYNK